MNNRKVYYSEVRGIYFEDGLHLSIIKENTDFWLSRPQLCALFECSDQRIQLAMTRLRRQENFIFGDVMSKIPLVLQHQSTYTQKICENVRGIQHFNQVMVTRLAQYIPSVHIERFLYWCDFLSKNSYI